MRRRYEKLHSPAIGREVQVLAFGDYGAPVIAFPTGGGQFFDFEENGMIGAVSHLIGAGKIKVYCPESLDLESWLNQSLSAHDRALRHGAYEAFITDTLLGAIRHDCRDPHIQVALTGCSMGAFHAATLALKHPRLFPYALCMSGRYDAESFTGPSDSQEVYYNNPVAFVPNLAGEDLSEARRTHLTLVCGQGAWEEKCLSDTHRLANLLAEKSIPHERDIWGPDVEHHWYWWQRQASYHLNRMYS